MKKTKTILFIAILALGSFLMAGCGKEKEENKGTKTVAQLLKEEFETEIKKEKDLEKVAQKISENENLKVSTGVESIKDGDYLTGFKIEIKGFKKAVAIRPMIGTIPFVVYLFEVEDPSTFSKTLEDNADLRWNICTEADEMKVSIVDNYVFFIMSPKNFEEE